MSMPTEKESLDYIGEFLMKYYRDQALFTIESISSLQSLISNYQLLISNYEGVNKCQ
jgi:hypothetical protein